MKILIYVHNVQYTCTYINVGSDYKIALWPCPIVSRRA